MAQRGNGFIAVFITAMMLRAPDRGHDFHLAEFSEQIERGLMVIVLLVFGAAIASGVLTAVRWEDALAGGVMLLLIRPAIGWIAPAAIRSRVVENCAARA